MGYLNFAWRIVVLGRAFCVNLAANTSGVKKPHNFVRITKEMREDLEV